MGSGAQMVQRLFAELKVEEEWATPTESGFRWWPGRQAQTIEVVREAGPAGPEGDAGRYARADATPAGLVSVRTDLLRGVELTPPAMAVVNQYPLQMASLAGPAYDAQRGSLTLCSLVRVRDGDDEAVRLLKLAAELQIGEARLLGAQLAPGLRAEVAASGHPEHGERPQPHELAGTVDRLIAAKYGAEPAWTEDEVRDVYEHGLDESLALGGTRDGAGFTTEFRCGRSVSVGYVRADQPHPRYGPGLFVLQTLPLAPSTEPDGVELALFFNGRDLVHGPFGLGLGSYAFREGGLYFTSFFPNAAHRPGLLADVHVSCAERAAGVAHVLAEVG